MKSKCIAAAAAAVFLTAALAYAVSAPAQETTPKLTNAARREFGARVSVVTPPDGSRDPQTDPDAVLDGNVHTRCVLRGGVPYSFVITLPFPVPVERVAFAHSDYANERAPKDIEVRVDDGAPVRHTLELKRPERRRPTWQEVPVGKTARTIRVTVLSDYDGAAGVNWGGLAEIAVLTPEDVPAKFVIPGYDAASLPTFVHVPTMAKLAEGGASARALLPEPAKPGEHPRLLLTKAEAKNLRATLESTEKGKAALAALVRVADGAVTGTPGFPDPKGPQAQVTDRGDAIARQHDRISLNAGTLGIAYALTGEKRYAEKAAQLLRGYAERYADYPEHKGVNRNDTGKVMAQRLSEAMWLIPLILAYDYIYDSGTLTPDDRRAIDEKLIRPAVTFIRRKEPAAEVAERDRSDPDWRTAPPKKGSAANWLLYYNAATMMAGSVMDDRNLMDLAAADFRHLLANGIGSDGLWVEGAMGYQFFALTALVPGMEAAARAGIDLWSYDNRRVQRLFDSPLRYAYPDGTAPGINDSGRTRFGDWSTMVYDYAYLRFGDPAYANLVNASPRQIHMSTAVYFPTRLYERLPEEKAAASPSVGSTVFESLGYSILRQPGRAYALLDYGPHGGVHGHFDKLNLILYGEAAGGKGDELGGEPVFHRYEDPLHGEWTKHTVAHNTLAVDGASQTASEGKLLLFEETPQVKVMRAQSATSYPGALLDRTVIVTPDAVLDLYYGRSPFARTWDRTLRFQGKMRGFPEVGSGEPLGTGDGFQRLKVVGRPQISSADSLWQGTWETTAGPFTATVAGGAAGQQVLLARGPDKDEIAVARQEGERAAFGVSYTLEGWRNPVTSLRRLPTGSSSDIAAYEMKQKDGAVTTVFVAHRPGAWQAAGWRSDARVLYVHRKGGDIRLLIGGGTFADGGAAGSLRRDAPGNYYAEGGGGKGLAVKSAWAGGDRSGSP